MISYYSSKQIIVLIAMVINIVPPTKAYGYAKCVLTFKNTEYADCVQQGIVLLEESIHHLPNSTLWLNVSKNGITRVKNNTFLHLPKLLELQLGNNKISMIEVDAFRGLEYLLYLNLGNNFIQFLHKVDMKDLKSLQKLDLGHNKLSTIENVTFPLNALQELDLSSNYIKDFRIVSEAVTNLNNLVILNMSFNLLTDLQCGKSLVTLSSLHTLDLRNNRISMLDLSNVYMPNLSELYVNRNNMSSIVKGAFLNAPNLSHISFDENPLNISVLLQSNISKLTALHWSSMRPALQQVMSLACQVFQSFPQLRLLDIKHAKITSSKLPAIGGCTNLTALILSTTTFGSLVKTELRAFKNLEVLYLDKCKLKAIRKSTWTGLKALHTLYLMRNRLLKLPDFLFTPLINLSYLDLSKNHLTYINPYAFKGLKKLTYLNLRSCKIAVVTRASFSLLFNLRHLDVQDNSISLVKSNAFYKLKYLDTLLLSGNKIQTIQVFGLQGLKSLKTLSLSNNLIYKFTERLFRGLQLLENLDLSVNMLTFNKLQSARPFVMLTALKTLDISYQIRKFADSIPDTLFDGLKSLETLKIQGISLALLQNVTFSTLKNLSEVDMSETFEGTDPYSSVEVIRKLSQLRRLILDNNKIGDLPEDTFAKFLLLEKLSLRNNKLRNISQNFLKPLKNLSYFDAYMNPLSCSCENYWFQNWSELNTEVQVPFIQSYNCFGQVARDLNFVNQDLSFCGTDISVFFFLGSFSLTSLLMVGNLLTMRLKLFIHYLYYMLWAWCHWKLQKDGKIYEYDAYISYCCEDEEWVMDKLLFHLESQGKRKYKLCFKTRDFIPGVYHIDNIKDSIKNSRKTLCVVSKKYLENQWCRMEVEMACSRVFYQKEDVLIVVFLEEIPDYRLSAYHKLRKLIKQNTYINWPQDPQGQELFWFKLRKALHPCLYEEETLQLSVTMTR